MVAKSTKVVMRWKMQSAVRCLDAWRELTLEEVRKKQVMVRIVQRMRNKCISAAIDIWCTNAVDLKIQHAEDERKQKLMQRIVSRMMNKWMVEAFSLWFENVNE